MREEELIKKFNANSFEKLLKFVIKKACELNKIEDQIFNQGWNDFKSFIKIRDRITHPKYEEGILVSEDDYKIIENAKKMVGQNLKNSIYLDLPRPRNRRPSL